MQEEFNDFNDLFLLARPAKKIDFIYAVVIFFHNISVAFTEFFYLITKIIHFYSVNEAKKLYLWEELSKDIEKMEAKDG